MTDIKSPEDRSRNMSKIKSRDTKPELAFRKMLFSRGYRYRKNVNSVFGCPDVFLGKYKTAVFVHGCFWHRHEGCKYAYTPKSRTDFWNKKFQSNKTRDDIVKERLRTQGIKVLIVWECSIKQAVKNSSNEDNMIEEIETFLRSDDLYYEI